MQGVARSKLTCTCPDLRTESARLAAKAMINRSGHGHGECSDSGAINTANPDPRISTVIPKSTAPGTQ